MSSSSSSSDEESASSRLKKLPANIKDTAADLNLRREVRREYQELISETQRRAPEDDDFLSESFRQADNLISKVSKPREAIFDSTLVNIQANIIKQKTQSLHANLTEFKPEEFAGKFELFFGSGRFGTPKKRSYSEMFQKFGYISKQVLPTTPPFFPLYSTFEKTDLDIPKKVRVPRKKDEISKEVEKPKSIDPSAPKGTDQEATAAAERVLNILHRVYSKDKEPVCYFSFLTNPNSFAETVENMFYCSILAKEGAVEIGLDKDGVPFIEPMTPEETSKVRRHGSYTQNMITIDPTDFENICREFNLTRPVITRKKARE